MAEEQEGESLAAPPPPAPEDWRCKRTDGKSWRCKCRRVEGGRGFCEVHHLQKLASNRRGSLVRASIRRQGREGTRPCKTPKMRRQITKDAKQQSGQHVSDVQIWEQLEEKYTKQAAKLVGNLIFATIVITGARIIYNRDVASEAKRAELNIRQMKTLEETFTQRLKELAQEVELLRKNQQIEAQEVELRRKKIDLYYKERKVVRDQGFCKIFGGNSKLFEHGVAQEVEQIKKNINIEERELERRRGLYLDKKTNTRFS